MAYSKAKQTTPQSEQDKLYAHLKYRIVQVFKNVLNDKGPKEKLTINLTKLDELMQNYPEKFEAATYQNKKGETILKFDIWEPGGKTPDFVAGEASLNDWIPEDK